LAVLGLAPLWASGQILWDNGGANNQWGTAQNWSTNSVPTSASNVQFNATDDNATVSNISLGAERAANSLIFNNVNDNFSLLNGSGSQTLRLTSRLITRTAGSSGNQTLAFDTLASQNDWDAGWSWDINGTGSLAISSTIAGGWDDNVKTGNGTLILSGNNTYDGLTLINQGVIVAASNTALGSATYGNTIASGAALHLQNNITLQEDNFQIAGSGISGTGAIRNLSGNNTLDSSINLDSAATVGSDAGTLTVTSQLALAHTLTATGAGNVVFSGAIHGANGIVKNGAGTLTLSGTQGNSFSGGLNINDGTVALAKTAGTNAIGGSVVTIGDGTGAAGSARLRLDASNQVADHAGLITINSDGVFALNNFTESVNQIAGTGRIDLGATGTLTVGINSGSSVFGGSLLGTGTFIKAGSGLLEIATDIAFGGTFTLAAGTLRLNDITLTLATLNISGNSTIDFAGVDAALYVTTLNIGAGVTLTITNWNDAADYFFATNWNGAIHNVSSSNPMNQVVFSGYNANLTHWQSFDSQVTPVPEPSTYGVILLAALLGFLGFRRFRRAHPLRS
jgi:autotransporter-associated beta strand protein